MDNKNMTSIVLMCYSKLFGVNFRHFNISIYNSFRSFLVSDYKYNILSDINYIGIVGSHAISLFVVF